jgi:hypothetical protein
MWHWYLPLKLHAVLCLPLPVLQSGLRAARVMPRWVSLFFWHYCYGLWQQVLSS